ncbi:hypothetical protein PRIPAC_97064 [Pristionchus pacificus]|uniref:Uncharacterized protein n=1 Tax=Pristionchus pacificus TaxID=54126 RepID=A0A2A6D0S9_PRIPA|nr:hypothetical protein PRIPAC_97064 [Pristionchus pacificus]|eukprot:PDM83956.1 hypothetical protein PRIPAC_34148 [Pristionchus pacificus]
MIYPLFIALLPLLDTAAPPIANIRRVSYTFRVTGAIKCAFKKHQKTWINISLYEDDPWTLIHTHDDLIDYRNYLIPWYQSARLSLGGRLEDTPFDDAVEPYLHVRTNCTPRGWVEDLCLELPSIKDHSSLHVGVIEAPEFAPLKTVPCKKYWGGDHA